jgi:hypothetical protein
MYNHDFVTMVLWYAGHLIWVTVNGPALNGPL